MPFSERRCRYSKLSGDETSGARLLRYSKYGLMKFAQLTSEEIRTSKVYSDAVGDTCRSRFIWISCNIDSVIDSDSAIKFVYLGR